MTSLCSMWRLLPVLFTLLATKLQEIWTAYRQIQDFQPRQKTVQVWKRDSNDSVPSWSPRQVPKASNWAPTNQAGMWLCQWPCPSHERTGKPSYHKSITTTWTSSRETPLFVFTTIEGHLSLAIQVTWQDLLKKKQTGSMSVASHISTRHLLCFII